MNEYQAQREMCDDGLMRFDMMQPDAARFLEDIGCESTRGEALDWVNRTGYPILVHIGDQAPKSFTNILEPIPNREKAHTVGQPVALAHRFDCQQALRDRLREPGNKLKRLFGSSKANEKHELIDHHEARVCSDAVVAASDISMLNLLVASRCSYDHTLVESGQLADEMNIMTQRMRHFKHVWDDKSRGQVLIAPETDILHRRIGNDTGQVVWHVDSLRGCIFFCLLNDQAYPHRVLFKEDGEIEN